MRVTPSMHFSLPECKGSPKRIAGYLVPAGIPTIIDVRRLNFNTAVWGADAGTFRPERFVGLDSLNYRFGFVRWGIGWDKCLGKNMTDGFLKGAAIEVLTRFALDVPEEEGRGEVGGNAGKAKEGKGDGFTIGEKGEVRFQWL